MLVINRLQGMNDSKSIPIFLAAMKHEDKEVREAGFKGAMRYYGGNLPLGVTYEVDDAQQQRDQAVDKILDYYTNPPIHTMPKRP